MHVQYAELLPDELTARVAAAPIAYLPLGTLEWHGPHMPLGADGIEPQPLFEALARQVGGVVLPMLFVGPDTRRTEDGMDLIGMDTCPMATPPYPKQILPGSAYWVSDELFVALLDQIVENMARVGIRIVVGHGHGPSGSLFLKQADRWRERWGVEVMNCWGVGGEDGYMIDHAARNETAITMLARPDLVKLDKLPPDPSVYPPGIGARKDGDPSEHPGRATLDYGQRCLDTTFEAMVPKLHEALARR